MRKSVIFLAVACLALFLSGPASAADGSAVYMRCFGCHKSTGEGGGMFPPLASNAGEIAKVPGGRAYMIQVVLFGLKGEIQVGGKTYKGMMPGLGNQLKDDEIAAVLNHVLSSWGNDKLLPKGHKEIGADEVKALRGKNLSPDQVHAERQKLKLK
ncbi:MAG TPA: cytochrome c [Candidatus Deferrimicrobiaceae bacterium]|nr:cytochrome c [Candidatus Deferrimicrobiaceae bacterium]